MIFARASLHRRSKPYRDKQRQGYSVTEFLWWSLYTLFAVWLQGIFSGVDCFGPALVLCLQAQRIRNLVFLLPVWVLLQEGAGSLPFGSALLYYMGLVYFVILVRAYISITSPLYILILSLFSGVWHLSVIHIITSLEDIHIAIQPLLLQSIRIVIVFPILWALVSLIYYFRIAPKYARI
jgi:hypothetical protein